MRMNITEVQLLGELLSGELAWAGFSRARLLQVALVAGWGVARLECLAR